MTSNGKNFFLDIPYGEGPAKIAFIAIVGFMAIVSRSVLFR